MERATVLTAAEGRFVADARRAVLATVDSEGRPRLVPICHVLTDADPSGRPALYTPIDEKPKRSTNPGSLARVRDIRVRSQVTVLVDRWEEDWTRLAWVRLHGEAIVLQPGGDEHAQAIRVLRRKYPQYASQRLEDRPIIRILIERARSWGALP